MGTPGKVTLHGKRVLCQGFGLTEGREGGRQGEMKRRLLSFSSSTR
jgi:hypothetical protein